MLISYKKIPTSAKGISAEHTRLCCTHLQDKQDNGSSEKNKGGKNHGRSGKFSRKYEKLTTSAGQSTINTDANQYNNKEVVLLAFIPFSLAQSYHLTYSLAICLWNVDHWL